MNNRQYKRLELTWYNKDKVLLWDEEKKEYFWVEPNDIRVSEPRILTEKETVGKPNSLYKKVITHDKGKLIPEEKEEWQWIEVSDLPQEEQNLLIKGDNLLALKALEQDFTGKIKLIYIDPPFNTGNAFEYYDDGLEHSVWLSMMKSRLEILQKLLRDDGIICVHIDDAEVHYLKALLDEIFGRNNFFSVIYIQTVYSDKTLKQDRVFHDLIEQILIYKNTTSSTVNQDYMEYDYSKFNWYITENYEPLKTIELGGKKVDIFPKRTYTIRKSPPSKEGLKEIWASGTVLDINSSGRFFRDHLTGRVKEDGLSVLYKVYGIGDDNLDYRYFTGPKRKGATKGKYYQGIPKKILNNPNDTSKKISIENFWDMAADFGNCRQEGRVELKSGKKPEILLMKLLKYFSDERDYILDSFLGSGTTAAVAHKMNRRWIGIELGEHAETHCLPRLKRVVSGEDQTGISKEVNWKGGGGFRYCILGKSLFKVDKETKVIELSYDNGPMIEAVCKIEGFKFVGREFVNKTRLHGVVNGIRYCHVTEEFVTQDYEDELSSEIKENESLVIYCLGYQSKLKLPPSIEIKKIPRDVAKKFILNSNRGKENGSNSR